MKKRRFKLTRTHILFALIAFAIWMSMCANKKEVDNGFFPRTNIDKSEKEQLVELQSYHSYKGLATVDDGFITIKK